MNELVRPAELFGDERGPWDRFDDESAEDHALFTLYRGQGVRRTLKTVAELGEVSVNSVSELSKRYSWVARATAFDDMLERQARRELAAQVIHNRKKVAATARLVEQKVVDRLLALDPNELSPRDLISFWEMATKLSRQAHGDIESTRVELTGKDGGPIEVANEMPAEERQELLAEIMKTLKDRAGLPELEGEIVEGEIVDDA